MTQSDIPQFKLAKIGKDKRRKKGGAAFGLGGNGSGSGSFFSGLFGPGAGLLSRLAPILMTAVVGLVAVMIGNTLSPSHHRKPKAFSDTISERAREQASTIDASKLPGDKAQPSSLNMVAGQAVDPSAQANQQAQAGSDQGQAANASSQNQAPEAPAPDPNQLAAAAVAAAGQGASGDAGKGPFGTQFGKLSTGMSGGSSAARLSGGSGLAGGIGGKLGALKARSLQAFARSAKVATVSARAVSSHASGRAFGQAKNISNLSRGPATSATNAAYNAGAGFDNPHTIQGQVDDGGVTGAHDPNNSADPNGQPTFAGGNNDSSSGGGTNCNLGDTKCLCKLHPNDATCQDQGKDVTPWAEAAKAATNLLMIAGALLLVASLLGKSKNPYALAAAMILAISAAAMGAAAMICGAEVMHEGGGIEGLMYVLLGGITTYMAIVAAIGDAKAYEAQKEGAKQSITQMAKQAFAKPIWHENTLLNGLLYGPK